VTRAGLVKRLRPDSARGREGWAMSSLLTSEWVDQFMLIQMERHKRALSLLRRSRMVPM
jgi:hypothetical protein